MVFVGKYSKKWEKLCTEMSQSVGEFVPVDASVIWVVLVDAV